jgi:hypothetical protein
MGNSKVILLGAASLMIGMYVSKIQDADRRVTDVGGTRSNEYQAMELAKTGVDLAVTELSSINAALNATRTKSIFGGSVTYVLNKIDADNEMVTSTATFGSETRTYVAYLTQSSGGSIWVGHKKKNWSRWEAVKVYVQPNQIDWTTQGENPI